MIKSHKIDYLSLFVYLLFSIYFFSLLLNAFDGGGRWSLNEQIAFGDRVVNGVVSYANGIDDLFFPSSPYFPGVGFISAFIEYLGVTDLYILNKIMLCIAVVLGFSYIIILQYITKLFKQNISTFFILVVSFILYISSFHMYKFYMWEFKPDTILLVITTVIFILLEIKEKLSYKRFIVILILLFLASFMKQSVFITYFITVFLLITKPNMSLKNKISLSSIVFLTGVLSLFLLFQINNNIYFTVTAMGQHPFLTKEEILTFFKDGVLGNKLYIIFLIFYIVKNVTRLKKLSIEFKYFVFATIWFLFSLISTAKLGGNLGNFQVGLIVYLPFVIIALDQLTHKFNDKNIFKYVVLLYAFGLFMKVPENIYVKYNSFSESISNDRGAISFLSTRFANKKAFIDGDTYIVAQSAGMDIITEAETVAHFNNIIGYDMTILKNALSNQVYDVIFLKSDLSYYKDKSIQDIIQQKYVPYEKESLPKHLQKNILLLRKEK